MSTKERTTSTSSLGSSASQSPRNSEKQSSTSELRSLPTTSSFAGPKTRITIQYDVGFSNAIYIRGQGAGLSWEKGRMLKNIKPNEWAWETLEPFTSCEFKVLINDQRFERGQNHTLTCGASIHYTPNFE